MISYTKEDYTKVLNLHKEGLGCRRISKKTNVPAHTVYNWLYKNVKPMKISEKFKQTRIWLDKERWDKVLKKATRNRLKSKKFWEGRKIAGEKISKKLPESAKTPSRELAYILGVIHGDGFLGKWEVKLKVKDFDFAKNFLNNVFKWSGHKCSIKKGKKGLYIVRFYSTLACQFLSKIKFAEIKTWNPKEKASLLRGLYDSDGSASRERITFTNSNKKLVDFVSLLLNEFKIEHRIISRRPSKGAINKRTFIRKRSYHILITNYKNKKRFFEKIGFSIKRKTNKLVYLRQPPKNNFVTKEVVNKMFELRKQKFTYSEIAEKLNLGYGTVIYHMKKEIEGVPPW